MGSPGSCAESFRMCLGSTTTRSRNTSCDDDVFRLAFSTSWRRRHPEVNPLSRLNTQPALSPLNRFAPLPLLAWTRMTRGRCDSLNLHRMKHSFITSRRFNRRTNAWGLITRKYLTFINFIKRHTPFSVHFE